MTQSEILQQLETKFQGVRKDGLNQLAAAYALTFGDDGETIKNKISELTEEQVSSFVAENRKAVDAEISKAIKTNETNLKAKYEFIEKGKKTELDNEKPDGKNADPDPTQIAIEKAIAKALAPITGAIAAMQSEKITANRQAVLESVLNEKSAIPNVYKNSILSNFKSQKFDTDEAFSEFVETTKKDLATFEQELTNNGFKNLGAPRGGNNGNPKPELPEEVAAYLKHETDNQFEGKKIF